MRLVDVDILFKELSEIDYGTNMDIYTNEVRELIDNTPTVEAYTKDEVIAMYKNLQLEIEEIAQEEKYHDSKWALGLKYSEKVIQQKINVIEGAER